MPTNEQDRAWQLQAAIGFWWSAPSGIRPRFLDRLRIAGIVLPTNIFEQSVEVA